MKKYRKGKLWRRAVFFCVIASLGTPFNTGTYALIFKMIEEKRLEWLFPYIIMYIAGICLIEGIIANAKNKAVNKYKAHVLTQIKVDCITDYIESDERDTSKALSFIDNDLNILMTNYFDNIFTIVSKASLIVFTLALTLSSNWIFAVIYLILGMLPFKVAAYLAGKTGQKTEDYSAGVKRTTALIKDVIRNKGTILNYRVQNNIARKVADTVADSENLNAERNNQLQFANMLLNVVYGSINMLPIAVGIYMGMKGYLSISAFVAVQYSSGWIVGSIASMAGLFSAVKSTEPICKKVEAFRTWQPKREGKMEAITDIVFDKVDFSYADGKQILKEFSMNVKDKEKVLIQGASGKGKSTILRLISGELNPDKGEVLLNGKKLENRSLGYITQEPAIFADTIQYNLTLGKEFTEEEINCAVEKAGLTPFVKENSMGFVLEEDGANVSGGQKQRIEIARALLYDRSVLLVDEGTSALDEESAVAVHETLMGLDKTVVEVAHYIPEQVRGRYDAVLTLN